MPRPRRPGAPEPKRRSRKGCWPCKARKVKCGEEKPSCLNCQRHDEKCDYSIRLNWEGRVKSKPSNASTSSPKSPMSAQMFTFSSQDFAPFQSQPASAVLSSPQTTVDDRPSTLLFDSTNAEGDFKAGTPVDATRNVDPKTGFVSHTSPHSAEGVRDDANNPSQFSPIEAASRRPVSGEGYMTLPYPSPSVSSLASVCYPESYGRPATQPELYKHKSHGSREISTASPISDNERFSSSVFKRLRSNSYSQTDEAGSLHHSTGGGTYEGIAISHSPHVLSPAVTTPAIPEESSPYPGTQTSSPDLNRVSVNALLSHSAAFERPGEIARPQWTSGGPLSDGTVNYGVDCGHPDLDLNRNNDSAAIERKHVLEKYNLAWRDISAPNTPESDAYPHERVTALSKGGYYARPVPVNIPKNLTPLPSMLLQNPINLLYFHHFLNHTARVLVPHDCEKNAFASVLPSMAVQDTNLLNLLLAYSASHRCRLLNHAEPANRIAHWARDIFPTLRHALTDPEKKISDTSLATAIMLVSLKIISPSTFEVPIPWQSHLKLARDLFMARRNAHPSDQSRDDISAFLGRWIGYLDVMGSLSCRQTDAPLLGGRYWSTEIELTEKAAFEIDCFCGFSLSSGLLLARVSELIHQCDEERVHAVSPDWAPSPHVQSQAEQLLQDMNYARLQSHRLRYRHSEQDVHELSATDEAFQLAGLLHLYRRVLGKDSSDPEVRDAVDALVDSLHQVPRGVSAEVCILFPLFTAGCEARDLVQRQEIHDRVKSFEGVGMKQIRRARKLMQRTWEENIYWTELANGEFLG